MMPVSGGAEVKLRIYMQDGSLQAGNLVSESENSFVIVTKEGRVDVPKNKIMFINGKTLKQWQERPDKLFQTEILPSEVPTPAYVNDKAPIPEIPKINPGLPPVEKPVLAKENAVPVRSVVREEAKPVETVKSAESVKPIAASAPISASVPITSSKDAASEIPVPVKAAAPASRPTPLLPVAAAPAEKKPIEKRVRRRKAVPEKPVVGSTPVVATKPEPVTERPTESVTKKSEEHRPMGARRSQAPRFGMNESDRRRAAEFHYQRAEVFMHEKQTGRAIQELHFATRLDRPNEQYALLLGRLYVQEGNFEKARKFFEHPRLKKKDEVKSLMASMDAADKKWKYQRWAAYGAAPAGLFLAWLPVLTLRRFRRKSKQGPRIIDADTYQPTMESPIPRRVASATSELTSTDLEMPVSESLSEPEATPEPAFMPIASFAKPPVKEPLKLKPAEPAVEPVAVPEMLEPPQPKSVERVPEKPALPPEPVQKPVVPPPPPPIEKPVVPPVPEPVPALASPSPEPEPVPVVDPGERVNEILELARSVSEALARGNDYVVRSEFDHARREYRTAMALSPACVEARLGLGFVSFSQGQWEMAMEHYLRALEIQPECAEAHYGIGRALLEGNRVKEAVSRLRATLELDPTFEDARLTLTALGQPV